MDAPTPRGYEFGPYFLDARERTLFRNGSPVRMPPKDFGVLLSLVANAGSVVEKDRLLREVWPDTFVEEANLTVHVARLRRTLGQGTGTGLYIETVPRRGYRFVAGVREVRTSPDPPGAQVGFGTGVSREGFLTGRADGYVSLAVLPLVNASGSEEPEYLSDGITESIISALSYHPRLKVLARGTVFRYKGREADAVTIGRELGVQFVLTGRVVRLGERLIIRVEVTEAGSGWQLWGAQYDSLPPDLLSIQGEVSRQICEALSLRLTPREELLLTKRHAGSVEAYRLYLRGRHHWAKYTAEGLRVGAEYFRMAVETDPACASAYLGLADSYLRFSDEHMHPKEALPKARAAALRALEIDESLAEAHATLALIRLRYDGWDWASAEQDFKHALALKPSYALAHQWYGSLLQSMGRFDEALSELAAAAELDPLSPQISVSRAMTFYFMGRYEEAVAHCMKALEIDPCHLSAHAALGTIYLSLRRFDESIAALQRARQLSDTTTVRSCLGYAYGVAGRAESARHLLDELLLASRSRYVSPYSIAIIYAGLGDESSAVEWLERGVADKSDWVSWLKVDPRLEALRSGGHLDDLLARIRLL